MIQEGIFRLLKDSISYNRLINRQENNYRLYYNQTKKIIKAIT